MDNKPTNTKTWKVCYVLNEVVSYKSNPRFGVLTLDADKIQLTGDDHLLIKKQEILSVEKVRWSIFAKAIRVTSKDAVIVIYPEAFHITRHIIFGSLQEADFQKRLLNF